MQREPVYAQRTDGQCLCCRGDVAVRLIHYKKNKKKQHMHVDNWQMNEKYKERDGHVGHLSHSYLGFCLPFEIYGKEIDDSRYL